MRPIWPTRPLKTLAPQEWDEKTKAFAEKHGLEYQPGDTIADLVARIPKREC